MEKAFDMVLKEKVMDMYEVPSDLQKSTYTTCDHLRSKTGKYTFPMFYLSMDLVIREVATNQEEHNFKIPS